MDTTVQVEGAGGIKRANHLGLTGGAELQIAHRRRACLLHWLRFAVRPASIVDIVDGCSIIYQGETVPLTDRY